MSADDRLRREARNQALFRDVNERIVEALDAMGPDDRAAFVCECGRSDCAETIAVPRSTYRDVRSHPRRFIVVPGHESLDAERVVDRTSSWVVVEAVGAAADEAERLA